MASNEEPIFGLSPVVGQVTIDTVNTNRDGSGAMSTLKVAGANGTRIDAVVAKATVSTNPGIIMLFLDDGAGNVFLWHEEPIAGQGASPTARSTRHVIKTPGLVLPPGATLKISTTKANQYRCFAHGQDF